MIRFIYIGLFIIFLGQISAQERFNTTFPLVGNQASNFIEKEDAGYFTIVQILDETNSGLFLKASFDSFGNFVDSSRILNINLIEGYVKRLNTNLYLIGWKDSSDQTTSHEKPYIAKFNDANDTTWTLHLKDFPMEAFPNDIKYIGGDSLIMVGTYKQTTNGFYKLFVSQLDTNGNEIWRQNYALGSGDQIANSITPTYDGGFLVCGATGSWGNGNFDWYLMKIDANGVFQWHKYWGSPTGEAAFCQALTDGNYILYGGMDNQWGHNSSYVMKVDPIGDTIWTANVELRDFGTDAFVNFVELDNGDLFFVGSGVDTNNIRTQGLAVKLSADGQFIWRRLYEAGPYSNYLEGVIKTSDGGFAMVGYGPPAGGDQDAWLVKVDSMGCDVPLCYLGERELGLEIPILKCFPNPTDGISTIQLLDNSKEIQLYNSSGQFIENYTLENKQTSYALNLSLLPHDIYILRLLDKFGQTIGQGKVVRK